MASVTKNCAASVKTSSAFAKTPRQTVDACGRGGIDQPERQRQQQVGAVAESQRVAGEKVDPALNQDRGETLEERHDQHAALIGTERRGR